MSEASLDISSIALLLFFAFGLGAFMSRMKQPPLVGYIIAGFVLGPSVLGIVNHSGSINFLAEMGILLLLFTVGLELDIRKFKSVYRLAITVTISQIIAGLLASFTLGEIFDWPLQRSIIIGFAISLSSTAVAIKILEDLKETQTTLGRGAIGILIAQDIAVIPMLLVIAILDKGEEQIMDYAIIFFAILFLALVILLLLRRPTWFEKLVTLIPERGQNALVALTLCFGMAALSSHIGLSSGYGAFIAGLIIGNTTKRHDYELNITPIFDIMIMVFFLSIGMLIDLAFVAEKFWRIMSILAIVMTIKTVINIGILRLAGLSNRNSIVMGAALGQIGEFSFVLAAMALSSHFITDIGYKYVVTLIALSLAITPLWLYAVRRLNLLRHRRNHLTRTKNH